MPLAGVVTLIGIALTVAALAFFLVRVALILKHVNFTLGTVIAGLNSIAHQTEPLGPVIEEINKDLADVQGALEGLLAKKAAAAETDRSETPA